MRLLLSTIFLLSLLQFALPFAAVNADEIPAGRIRELTEQLKNPATPRRAIPVTMVTLDAQQMPLADALREIEKQTGNKVVDERQQGGANPAADPRLTFSAANEPYWVALDKLLDAANLSVNAQSGSDALAITEREPGDARRCGRAVYAGPFRLEVLEVQSQRNARQPAAKSLQLQLEIAWEPRVRPLVVSQAAAELAASVDTIAPLTPRYPQANFSAEIPAGTQAIDLTLPFELPPRRVTTISSLRGKLRALVPGRQAKFEFGDLAHAAGKSQHIDDTEVVIDAVRKNNEIWEIHMRLRLDARNPALDAHRGWAFENRSYLVNGKGETIENAGLETTSEAKHEVGVAYFFDVEGGLDGMTWVYETPAGIAETQVDFELIDIELP